MTMNKSLAERIGKHTREVMAEREAEKREKNRADVLRALTEYIKSKASDGKSIFSDEKKGELDFSLYAFDEMSSEEVKIALKDIGFEIHSYPMCSVAAIPQENVSNEIQELLKMYHEILNDFENTETKEKAKEDCTAVLKKLEEGEYEVIEIDRVTVNFKSDFSSKQREQYETYVREMMEAQGFTIIDISAITWVISIIHKEGD